jgi:hypothetical protein
MGDDQTQDPFTPLVAAALSMHELYTIYLIGQSLHGDAMGRSAKQ